MKKGKWVPNVLAENQPVHIFTDNVTKFAVYEPRGLSRARKLALAHRRLEPYRSAKPFGGIIGRSCSLTEVKAIEVGVPPDWIERCKEIAIEGKGPLDRGEYNHSPTITLEVYG